MPTVITGTDGINQVQAGAVESGDLPAGSVIQRVVTSSVNSGEISTTSGTLVASGIQASITPQSSSNFIDVYFSASMSSDLDGELVSVMFVNGGQWPSSGQYNLAFREASIYAPSIFFSRYIPTSTSSILFEPYFRTRNSNSARLVHLDSSYALVLTEIAG